MAIDLWIIIIIRLTNSLIRAGMGRCVLEWPKKLEAVSNAVALPLLQDTRKNDRRAEAFLESARHH